MNDQTSTENRPDPRVELERLVMQLVDHLDSLDKEARLEAIDDALHRLNFERRVTALTEKQLQHMHDNSLSIAQRERLDACNTDEQRDEVITGYARATYFKQCAWSDYLNGATDEPGCAA